MAKLLATRIDLSELGLFAGYLGPHFQRDRRKWRLLFVDARLRQWLQIPSEDIVAETRQARPVGGVRRARRGLGAR